MSAVLNKLADEVHDEVSFVAFLKALARDWEDGRRQEAPHPSSRYSAAANGWENVAVGAFLEAASAWAEDTGLDTPTYTGPDNPWRRAARIIYAGKFYE